MSYSIHEGYEVIKECTPTNDVELFEVNAHLKSGLFGVDGLTKGSRKITFYCRDGFIITMHHEQDCCEDVVVESCDALNCDIYTNCSWCVLCVSISRDDGRPRDTYDESYTWTFYNVRTSLGYDTIRWYGTSNGYYSETVDFIIEQPKEKKMGKFTERYLANKAALTAFCSGCTAWSGLDCTRNPYTEGCLKDKN